MNEESQLHHETERGRQAEELMGHELMAEAFETLEHRITEQWAESPARDTEGRERLWLMKKLLKNVGDHLHEVAATGKMARIQLEQARTLKERLVQKMESVWD